MDVRVLTFNIWGLKYLASYRPVRIAYLGHLLATQDSYDVVCFQEAFVQADVDLLKRKGREGGLPYARHFRAGPMGSGLLTLSRFPIIASSCIPYDLNGYPFNPIQSDFFSGKGIGKVLLDLGNGRRLTVFNTHTYAPGGDGEPGKWAAAHRVVQIWKLSKLVNTAIAQGETVIVCGDLNCQPHTDMIRLLLGATGLVDTWPAYIAAADSVTAADLDPDMKTCDTADNTYSASKPIPSAIRNQGGKRLDYILSLPYIHIKHAERTLSHHVPNLNQSISDHFGYTATLSLDPSLDYRNPSCDSPPFENLDRHSLTQSLALLSLAATRNHKASLINLASFLFCLVILLPGICIGASFQPLSYLNWIFVLLAVVLGFAGATLFYVGFIFATRERCLSAEATEELQELLRILERRDIDSVTSPAFLRTAW